MITNQRQYAITKTELQRFASALVNQRAAGPGADVHPRIHQAMLKGYESQIQELQDELGRYDDLRHGRVAERTLDSLRDVPVALIEARIVAHLSQRALAEAMGLPEQQIQRWEANRYSGVSVDRLQDVADALGVRISETVAYAIPA
jgi:ribosome-binding protein aMBF1 (putative translation factor)